MFNIVKNRVNVVYSNPKAEGTPSTNVVMEMCNIFAQDMNILMCIKNINSLFIRPSKNINVVNDNLEDIQKNLFNIDCIVLVDTLKSKKFDNKIIDFLISIDKTVILVVDDINCIAYRTLDKDYKDLTYFIYEASWDKPGYMRDYSPDAQLSTYFTVDKNDYYLRNLQTNAKYSLYNWLGIEKRNRKFRKI